MQPNIFKREIVGQLIQRIREPRRFIQVVTGPRQVGREGIPVQAFLSQPAAYWLGK